jgi:hypothetical protein
LIKKLFWIIGTIILFLIITLSGCTETTEKDNLYGLDYKNTEYGFGLNPPPGWTTYGTNPNAIVTFAGPMVEDSFIISIAINIRALDGGQTIYKELNKAIINLSEVYEGFELVSRLNRTINGMNSHEIVYTIKSQEELIIKQKQILIEKKNKALILAFSATQNSFNTYDTIFEESLNTVKIIW